MKKTFKILKYLTLSIAMMAGLIFLISIAVPVKNTIISNGKVTTSNSSALREKHNLIRLTSMEHLGSQMWMPVSDETNTEVYCVQPGTKIAMANTEEYRTKNAIQTIVNNTKDTSYESCGEADNVDTYRQYYSDTYYRCVGKDYTESSSFKGKDGVTYDNLYDIAYIASYILNNRDGISESEWAPSKQQAIWQSQLVDQNVYNRYSNETSMNKPDGARLLKAARLYKDFYEKIMEVETDETSDSYGKTGAKPNSLLSGEETTLSIDKIDRVGKLGPFKIDYVSGHQWSGQEAGRSFGGISDMYLLDAEGTKIDLKNIIVLGQLRKVYNEGKEKDESTFFSNWDRGIGAYNKNCIDYLAYEKAFPQPGEEFYVEFELPEKIVGGLKLHIQFSYLKCEMEICLREAGQYFVDDYCKGTVNHHTHTDTWEDSEGNTHEHTYNCSDCLGRKATLGWTNDSQNGVSIEYQKRSLVQEEYDLTMKNGDLFCTTMKIGGFVFEDIMSGKDNGADGRLSNEDHKLKNIQVTLYEVKDDNTLELAQLATLVQEQPSILQKQNTEEILAILNDPNDYTRRTNPTLTDENGYYEFRGVDTTKNYIVKFTYNGQTYMPTEYLEGASGKTVDEVVKNKQYSSVVTNEIWNTTSKATEDEDERKAYDQSFRSIGSTPTNYVSSNSLEKLKKIDGKYYNEVYTVYELAGFTLNENGKYVYDAKNQFIDTYLTVKDGKIIESDEFKEGIINKSIKEYIDKTHQYPQNMQEAYKDIAGDDEQIWKKLQFIEDCKISAYTKNQESTLDKLDTFDQYPVYDYFTTRIESGNKYPNNSYANGTYASGVTTYANTYLSKNGVKGDALDPAGLARAVQYYGKWAQSKGPISYQNVYEGQLFINCGLWRRQLSDMALQKDVYKATIKINGKTETYQYDKRDTNDYWEIQTRIEDYDSYYGGSYNRALYPSDYEYSGENKLEVYITYKIAIRNQSQSILTRIDEVVDYYDDTYEYVPEYSWAMYDDVSLTQDEYYNVLTGKSKVGEGKFKTATSDQKGQYPSESKYSLRGYDRVYLDGLSDKKLNAGETGYLYLTFKVNEKANKVDIDSEKHNIAEINGYTTYYSDGIQLPNGVERNSKNAAGIIDYDSKPGNFSNSGLKEGRYEHNFEDDTDHAKGIRVYVDNALKRTISGMVWEDERNTKAAGTDAVIANGIRDKKERVIEGIKVEMYEVVDGELKTPAVMQKTSMESDSKGQYQFEGFIPGNYIIRFTYGGNVSATAKGYNGQDYKSTTYQAGIDQAGKTNLGTDVTYRGYTNTETQNETATYGYDITKADATNTNYSDAKDIWSYREKVNNYSSGSMKYEMANNLNNDKTIKNNNLQMIAETGVIAVEGEYNRTNSDRDENSNNGYNNINYINGNDINGKYSIQNVDFGLAERPKAQLELNKQVSNLKIVLANQNVLFDANESVSNLIWQPKKSYNLTELQKDNYYATYNNYNKFREDVLNRVKNIVAKDKNGLIQPTIDKELTHGATIQATYDITVTNVGEVDYNDKSFYYTGKVKDTSSIVKTSADVLIDYVANNLKYRDANNKTEWAWKSTSANDIKSNGYVSSDVEKELTKYNTIITTTSLNKKLIPLTSSTKNNSNTYARTQLILTQTITAQNEEDDLVYRNTSEIVSISNDVGRRMAFSIQGNQKPSEVPQEPDASAAERIVILPPFGDTYLYFGLGVAVLAIIVGAAVFIKKKVLKK